MASFVFFNPDGVPEPVGGYSQAVSVAGVSEWVVISGQIPQTVDGEVPEGFEAQARLAWENLMASLRAAGLGVEHLVKVTTFLTDRAFKLENRTVRLEFLGDARPASTVVIAQTLDERWLLELEAVAAR